MINVLIIIISILILASKFLDCYTTSSQINSLCQEKNPIARKFMKRFGIHTTIWIVFALSIIIVAFSVVLLFVFCNTMFYKITYVVLGTFISFTQFAVAHTNKTKRLNILTKLLLTNYTK